MKLKGILTSALAGLMIISFSAFAACGGKNKKNDHAAETLVEVGASAQVTASAQTPTAEPTAEALNDFSRFDKPLSNMCVFMQEPGLQRLKAMYPADFFVDLSQKLEAALAEAGMTISSLGYESFDAYLEASIDETAFSGLINLGNSKGVDSAEYNIVACEPLDAGQMKEALRGFIGDYLSVDRITKAYKLKVGFTVFANGSSSVNTVEVIAYEYDGQYYITAA